MTQEEFMDLTPVEFYYAIKDFDDVELRRIKTSAEAIRMSTWWLVNVQLPKRKKIRKPNRIMQFWFDALPEFQKAQTKEQMVATMKLIAGATKNIRGKKVTEQ